MRLPLALIAIIAGSVFTSGCVFNSADVAVRRLNHKAKASGSPYRWRDQSVPGGWVVEKYRIIPPVPSRIPTDLQPTTANAELRKDILAKIDVIQQGWGSNVVSSLLGVQPLGMSNGSVREAWFIKQGDGAIRFEVTTTPSSQGGTDFKIEGQ
jgi:hypothetical protein